MALKGKEIAQKTPPLKRKRDKSADRKRKSPGVLQFFDVAADVDEDDEERSSDDDDDDDEFDLDSMEEVNAGQNEKTGHGRTHNIPFLPKQEELSDDELEMLIEERYKPGSQYVVYAEDRIKRRGSVVEDDSLMHSADNPNIWRVKCTVGRERRASFCLIQKFVDLQSLGNKLKIASAFAPDHIKGYIYIEAEKEIDVLEACRGISNVYSSRILRVPKNEVAHLFSVRNTSIELPPGTWVRVKLGRYRGDLAQVVAFDDTRKKATVKLIPRIDLQAMAKKLAGGGTIKQSSIPAARVISSKDLEEFRSHIVLRHDHPTQKVFETLDGLKIKDGYLYKRVSIESISYVDVAPSADELLKFKPYKKDASDDTEWLSHLYGEQQRKKRSSDCGNGTAKDSVGTSGTKKGEDFQLRDLVFFGPKDFGVIIGVESDSFQILKYDETEGAEVLTIERYEVKDSSFDKKYSTMDQQMKVISINDTVRVNEGPFTGRQGVVKYICKGTIFIYNENQLENAGYFCAKPKLCENISHSDEAIHKSNGDAFGAQAFEGFMSPPKSPQQLSKKPWEEKENSRDFNSRRQGDREGGFSVGQTLRIRVGPLKGHICRVVSIYRSNVTVKVDSQTKVLSVKSEHLSEAGVKSNFRKQNDGFGSQGEASGPQTESNGWGSAPLTTGSSWPDFAASGFSLDSSLKSPFDSLATAADPEKEKGDDPWGCKVTSKKITDSWGNAAGSSGDLEKGKEEGDDPWRGQRTSGDTPGSWGTTLVFGQNSGKDNTDDLWGSKETSKKASDSWGNGLGSGDVDKGKEGDDPWGSRAAPSKNTTDSWGSAIGLQEDTGKGKGEDDDAWRSKVTSNKSSGSWENTSGFGGDQKSSCTITKHEDKGKGVADNDGDGWQSAAVVQNTDNWGEMSQSVGNNGQSGQDTWGKAAESWREKDGSSKSKPGWTQSVAPEKSQNDSWSTPKASVTDGASSWCKETTPGTENGWNNQKGTEGGRGFDWNSEKANGEGTMDNKQNSWSRARNIEGGPGSGGRRGRGGCRGGNRDSSGRGRSFGRGRSSDWNGDQSDSWKRNDASYVGQGSRWGNTSNDSGGNIDQGNGWDVKASTWKSEATDTDGDKSSGWGTRSMSTPKNSDGWDTQVSSWKSTTVNAGENKSSGWGSTSNLTTKSSGWENAKPFDATQTSGLDGGAGDASGKRPSGWGSVAGDAGLQNSSGWGSEAGEARLSKSSGCGESLGAKPLDTIQTPGWGGKVSDVTVNKSSGWGKSVDLKHLEATQTSGWECRAGDAINKSSSWGSVAADAGGDKSSGWGTSSGAEPSEAIQTSGWASGAGDASANKFSGWGSGTGVAAGDNKYCRGSKAGDAGVTMSSGWGSKAGDAGTDKSSGWVNGAGDAGADKSSGWGSGAADSGVTKSTGWGCGAADLGVTKSSGWGSGADAGINKSSGWGSQAGGGVKESSGSGSGSGWGTLKDSQGNKSSDWNQGAATGDNATNWQGGNSSGGAQTSGWTKRIDTDVGESDYSNRGRGFGRGRSSGSNRGGFGNRGHDNVSGDLGDASNRGRGFGWGRSSSSDRGGFTNRGRSGDSGGSTCFSNRGRGFSRGGSSGRGGFGNRGRGRSNHSGDWNGENCQENSQSFGRNKDVAADDQVGGWNKGTSNDEGWASKPAGSWNKSSAGGWGSNQVSGDKGTRDAEGWADKPAESWNRPNAGGWGNQISGNQGTTTGAGWAADKQTETKMGGRNKSVDANSETSGSGKAHTWGNTGSWGTEKGSSGSGGWGSNQVSGDKGTRDAEGWVDKPAESWNQPNAGGWGNQISGNQGTTTGAGWADEQTETKMGGRNKSVDANGETSGSGKAHTWGNTGLWGTEKGSSGSGGWGSNQVSGDKGTRGAEGLADKPAKSWNQTNAGGWGNQISGNQGTTAGDGWADKQTETKLGGWNIAVDANGEASGSGEAHAWQKVGSWGTEKGSSGSKGGW